ncbi:MAG TPA: OmpA family protein [Acetobacteraceae bacterium]|jgi:OOP family OmpA-OmpF porin|nr:OmpA family protein [Acetobacteraceae bacterium]
MRRFGCLLLLALVAACTTAPAGPPHKIVVFFQEWSAALDPAAALAVGAAGQWAKDHPNAPVKVVGYADPTGSAQANDYMSLTRAQIVADQLVTDGVPRDRIVLGAHGATDFTLTSQESRRVEIAIGGP